MFADYEFYKNQFGGTKIKTANEYKYLGQQASQYIKQYTDQNILLMRTPETNKDVVYLMNTKLRTATMSG